MTEHDPLIPIVKLLEGWSPRRVADNARLGRFPGAFKLGRTWVWRRSDYERWIASQQRPRTLTIDEAAEILRKKGINV